MFVDAFLAEKLRPHQKEGVKFMYDCISGHKGKEINGCILADLMGLGKTLQTISLLYTLLRKSNPYTNSYTRGVIIAPCTLLLN